MPYGEPFDFEEYMKQKLADRGAAAGVGAGDETAGLQNPGKNLLAMNDSTDMDIPFGKDVETITDQDGSPKPQVPIDAPKVKLQAAAQPNVVKDTIAKKYGYGDGLDNDALRGAQDDANQARFGANIGQAFNKIGYAIAGVPGKEDNSGYQQMAKQAEVPVENIMQGRAAAIQGDQYAHMQAGQDKDSPQAQVYRAILGKVAPKALDGIDTSQLTPADAPLVNPLLEHNAKLEQAKELAALRAQAMGTKAATTASRQSNDRITKFGDALDENKGRTGEFGRQVQFVNNADRVLALKQQFPDGDIPPTQMAELASASAALISGGSHGAEATVNRFVPKTLSGSEAGIAQWLTSDPHGAGQQAFAKLMFDTAIRERAIAAGKVKQTKMSRVAQYADVEQSDPDRFNAVLSSHGLDPDEYQQFKKAGFKSAPEPRALQGGAGGGQDPKIIKYAADNGLDYEHASTILKGRGYGG